VDLGPRFFGGALTSALSAVDIAGWNFWGKVVGQSVCALLGAHAERSHHERSPGGRARGPTAAEPGVGGVDLTDDPHSDVAARADPAPPKAPHGSLPMLPPMPMAQPAPERARRVEQAQGGGAAQPTK